MKECSIRKFRGFTTNILLCKTKSVLFTYNINHCPNYEITHCDFDLSWPRENNLKFEILIEQNSLSLILLKLTQSLKIILKNSSWHHDMTS